MWYSRSRFYFLNEVCCELGMRFIPDKSEVLPCFQPVLDTFRLSVAGHEVLGRLRAEDGQLSSLGPLFHNQPDSESLRELDRHIRRLALQQFVDAGQPGYLTLNVTPSWMQDLKDDAPVPTLEMVQELGVDPAKVVIEFIEGAGEN